MAKDSEIKKYWDRTKDIVKTKRFQNISVIVLFLLTLYIGVNIRMQPIVSGNLIDQTTGDYTPLALDPYYFLRMSEHIIDGTQGLDTMRAAGLGVPWHHEILSKSTVWIYKIIHSIDSGSTLNYADVLNPVIFFAFGLIVFFILSWVLTKNKWIALIASFILIVIPPYLYRTLGGFTDHESIGMVGFFLAMLSFSLGIIYLEGKSKSYLKSSVYGLISGLMVLLSIATWSGISKFLFMILPLTFFIIWLIKEHKSMYNYLIFYGSWIIGVLIFNPIFHYSIIGTLKSYMFSYTGILTLFAFFFALLDTILLKNPKLKNKIKRRRLSIFVLLVIAGGLFYNIFIGNIFSLILSVISPFGSGRLLRTVAELKESYLNDLIAQIGKVTFYTFLVGCFIVGGKIASGIRNKKLRPLFTATFIFFVIGILFSAVSETSILNSSSFISKALFFVSFLSFLISSIYIYNKSDWNIDVRWILIAAWMIPMLLAVRGAIRFFFAIVPFMSIIVTLGLYEVIKWGKKSKDDIMKMISYVLVIVVGIMLIFSLIGFYKSVKYQAENQVPSYDASWQKAMGWVRNNTAEYSIFVHWWDYGYWVQTGGNRPTVADGGQVQSMFMGNEKIGRYLLTTPYPETAKSLMKSYNVSYLLIDPTDIGKYGAYSSIGTGDDIDDRTSWLVTLTSDPSETQETRNGTVRVYRGGTILDDDLVYNYDGQEIFLPKGRAGIAAITLERTKTAYGQPQGIYVYNNQQYRLPIRYLYASGQLMDFGVGINSTAFVYANVYTSSAGQQLDQEGALMYLSERTKDSLVAKLYLMDDPDNEYPELELVYDDFDYPFPFYYGGFRGPIKIWKTNIDEMDNIIAHDEFWNSSVTLTKMDGLKFIQN